MADAEEGALADGVGTAVQPPAAAPSSVPGAGCFLRLLVLRSRCEQIVVERGQQDRRLALRRQCVSAAGAVRVRLERIADLGVLDPASVFGGHVAIEDRVIERRLADARATHRQRRHRKHPAAPELVLPAELDAADPDPVADALPGVGVEALRVVGHKQRPRVVLRHRLHAESCAPELAYELLAEVGGHGAQLHRGVARREPAQLGERRHEVLGDEPGLVGGQHVLALRCARTTCEKHDRGDRQRNERRSTGAGSDRHENELP